MNNPKLLNRAIELIDKINMDNNKSLKELRKEIRILKKEYKIGGRYMSQIGINYKRGRETQHSGIFRTQLKRMRKLEGDTTLRLYVNMYPFLTGFDIFDRVLVMEITDKTYEYSLKIVLDFFTDDRDIDKVLLSITVFDEDSPTNRLLSLERLEI